MFFYESIRANLRTVGVRIAGPQAGQEKKTFCWSITALLLEYPGAPENFETKKRLCSIRVP